MDYWTIFFDIIAALAVTALLAESYGFIRRKVASVHNAQFVLGILFGIMALVQMNIPFEPFDGVILDMRAVPIALAGAFLGWRGLLPCLAIAFATRYGIGGAGLVTGLLGMVISGFAGLIWARHTAHLARRNFAMMVVLALAVSTNLLAAMVLPSATAAWFFSVAAVPIFVVQLVAIPLIGSLLEREYQRICKDRRLAAAVTRHPESGLLTHEAFGREVANAYTVRPFGTFVGFLAIRPDIGLWASLPGVVNPTAVAPIDACALERNMEYGDLAGLCADGTVLVPITAWEKENITRVTGSLRDAMRRLRKGDDTFGLLEFDAIEVLEPADFIRIVDDVAAAAKWYTVPKASKASKRPNEQRCFQQSKIFDPNKHDILFAKADFLIDRSHG